MKPLGNNKDNKSDRQIAEGLKRESEAVTSKSDTQNLLEELKEAFEIFNDGKDEGTVKASGSDAARTDSAKGASDGKISGETKVIPAVKNTDDADQEQSSVKEKQPRLESLTGASTATSSEPTKKRSTGPISHNTVDDENLIAELHALIGDPEKPKARAPFAQPSTGRTAPAPRPLARITPDTLKDVVDDYDDVAEADTMGVPGWIKGLFILLFSLLLGAMTFYAVASDVIGEIF